jgi:hypothetical protein
MSFRGLFSLDRGGQQAQGGTGNSPTARAPRDNDEQSWLSVNPYDASAPNVGGQFGQQGGSMQFDLPGDSNPRGTGESGIPRGPPAYISHYWEDAGQGNKGVTSTQRVQAAPGPVQGTVRPTTPVAPPNGAEYSGMATAVKNGV